jgi:hypothetical protein
MLPCHLSCYLAGDLLRVAVVGGHGQPGQVGVQRPALLEHLPEPPARVAGNRRVRPVETGPLGHGGKPGLQVHHALPGQEAPRGLAEDRSAAEREHAAVFGDGLRHGRPLEIPERVFAVVDEDVADLLASARSDQVVGFGELHAQQRRQKRAHGGLAGARRADEDHGRPRGVPFRRGHCEVSDR